MIIECPKCKARFEVPETAFKFALQRFSCASCGFVFTAARPRPLINDTPNDEPVVAQSLPPSSDPPDEPPDAKQLLRSLGFGEPVSRGVPIFTRKNLQFALLGVFMVLLLTIVTLHFSQEPGPARATRQPREQHSDLFIEVARNLTVIREAGNEFVPLRGYILNTGRETLSIPRLVVRIENRNGQLLQEQEHDPPVPVLAPGEAADFEFRIFRFSDQMSRFIVNFREDRPRP